MLGGYWAALPTRSPRNVATLRPSIPGAVLLEQSAPRAESLGADAALLGAIWSARDRLLQDPLQLIP